MADNITTTDGTVATDEIDTLNGAPQSAPKPQAQRVKLGHGADGVFNDASDDAPLPVRDVNAGNVLLRILQMLMAPLGYDKSLQRQRSTAIIESGTVTTVNTVTTVTTLANITSIGGYTAQMLVLDQNRSSWAQSVRSRIS